MGIGQFLGFSLYIPAVRFVHTFVYTLAFILFLVALHENTYVSADTHFSRIETQTWAFHRRLSSGPGSHLRGGGSV